jgi:hypothetical protein
MFQSAQKKKKLRGGYISSANQKVIAVGKQLSIE